MRTINITKEFIQFVSPIINYINFIGNDSINSVNIICKILINFKNKLIINN